ncbi:hypothetical protein P8452_72602 [Trifolium repens]|nr:hypothetical protein P8452_72602 [Trifolium repens]
MMIIVSTASDLIQDFKIGYMTLASPKFMFAKVIETAMGCIISLCVFWLFYHTFGTLGQSGSTYLAPFAVVYRNIAILGPPPRAVSPVNDKVQQSVTTAHTPLALTRKGLTATNHWQHTTPPPAIVFNFRCRYCCKCMKNRDANVHTHAYFH